MTVAPPEAGDLDARPRFRPVLLYPLLFAAHPVLALAAANAGQFDMKGLLATLALYVTASALLLAAIALALGRNRRDIASLATFVVICWIFYLIPLSRAAAVLSIPRPFVVTVLIIAPVSLAILGWVLLRRPPLERATRVLATMGVLLVGWSAVTVLRQEARAKRVIASSGLVREMAKPVPVRPDSGIDGVAKRDVYVIVLDELANSEILQERFAFDNTAFEDSLRQLGFVVPSRMRSNYALTVMSLPSLLNFAQMSPLQSELGFKEEDFAVPRHLIEQNRTSRFLAERGYRFLFFPSSWWRLTLENPHADEEFRALPGANLRRALMGSEFRRTLLRSTLLSKLDLHSSRDMADHILRSFDALEEVPRRPEPTFVFAHVMAPHWPFVLDADCGLITADPIASPGGLDPADVAYLEQLKCVRTRTLRLVRKLLASSPAPIIVLQSDHGTKSQGQMGARTLPSVSALRERFGAFGAYYLPDGGAESFGEPATIVNILGSVLSYYFGADAKPEPDELFFSTNDQPFHLIPVSLESIARAP